MSDPDGRARARSDLGFALALALVALLPRLYVAVAWSREPVWDGHYYHFGAQRIAEGLGYSEDVWVGGQPAWRPWIHYPVGYSGLLAGVYKVFGSGILVAPLVNAIAGTLLAFVSYELARFHLGRARACLAGALVALHPGLIAYSGLVMTEIVAATLLTAVGAVLLWYRGRMLGLFVAGLLLGAAVLVRPASILLLPFALATQSGPVLRRLRDGAILAAATMLVVLPWTLRNCQRFDGCALVSANGGWNLAIGAISETGRFQTLKASDGCAVVRGQVDQDRCWAAVGQRRIRENPGRWIGLMPKKLAETFNHESFAFEYLHEADPVSWTEPRRVAGRGLTSAWHRMLLVLAALGVIARPRFDKSDRLASFVQGGLLALALVLAARGLLDDQHPLHWLALFIPLVGLLPLPGRPEFGPAGLFLLGSMLCVVVTHAVFFGEDRYHLVVSPILCLLAAGALRPAASAARRSSAASSSQPVPILRSQSAT